MLFRCGRGGAGGELGPRDEQDQRQRRDVRQDAGQARDPWVVVPLIEQFFARRRKIQICPHYVTQTAELCVNLHFSRVDL